MNSPTASLSASAMLPHKSFDSTYTVNTDSVFVVPGSGPSSLGGPPPSAKSGGHDGCSVVHRRTKQARRLTTAGSRPSAVPVAPGSSSGGEHSHLRAQSFKTPGRPCCGSCAESSSGSCSGGGSRSGCEGGFPSSVSGGRSGFASGGGGRVWGWCYDRLGIKRWGWLIGGGQIEPRGGGEPIDCANTRVPPVMRGISCEEFCGKFRTRCEDAIDKMYATTTLEACKQARSTAKLRCNTYWVCQNAYPDIIGADMAHFAEDCPDIDVPSCKVGPRKPPKKRFRLYGHCASNRDCHGCIPCTFGMGYLTSTGSLNPDDAAQRTEAIKFIFDVAKAPTLVSMPGHVVEFTRIMLRFNRDRVNRAFKERVLPRVLSHKPTFWVKFCFDNCEKVGMFKKSCRCVSRKTEWTEIPAPARYIKGVRLYGRWLPLNAQKDAALIPYVKRQIDALAVDCERKRSLMNDCT
jgi:hypothetical protein